MTKKISPFINVPDPTFEIRGELESYKAIYQVEHPEVNTGLAMIARMAIREGLAVLRARSKPRLEDKQRTRNLRK
jgi:hypothetical protein